MRQRYACILIDYYSPVSTSIVAVCKSFFLRCLLEQRAAEGGLAGAAAMAINVTSLMWIRTAINYQYRYGTSTREAFQKLYKDGGVLRYVCVHVCVRV